MDVGEGSLVERSLEKQSPVFVLTQCQGTDEFKRESALKGTGQSRCKLVSWKSTEISRVEMTVAQSCVVA